ncbi:MAG: nuclear transport factor 2 family protein [Bacteroidota bacterium]
MIQKICALFFILFVFNSGLTAQDSAEDEVKAAIMQMFDGMRAGDSAQVHAVISDDAEFYTSTTREGKPMLFNGSLDRFLKGVGTPHDKVWDERISKLNIQVDDNLATAWMNYSFYAGEDFSHCGVNTMTFHKGEKGWKIIFLADTRRKEKCD